MKQRRFLAIILAASTVFLFACGSGGDKKTEETATDSSKMNSAETTPGKTPETVSPATPAHVVIVKHRIASYSKWKQGYDGDDSARKAAGLSNYVIARGTGKDSNTLMVVLKASDVIRAKEFASSKDLGEAMKKAGVIGDASISYVDLIMDDNSQIPQTERLIVTHKVKDWDAWKQVFDSHKQARADAGIIDRALGYSSGDSHNVTIVFAITDEAKAKAFAASKELKDRMAEGGVEGTPSFFYFNIVQKY